MNWYHDVEENDKLICLAFYDESACYEVDRGGIYYDTADGDDDVRFGLITASGCSCWEGDADDEWYGTFEELKAALLGDGVESPYRPSLETAKRMIAEAEHEMSIPGWNVKVKV